MTSQPCDFCAKDRYELLNNHEQQLTDTNTTIAIKYEIWRCTNCGQLQINFDVEEKTKEEA